jgi:hypothetical protein
MRPAHYVICKWYGKYTSPTPTFLLRLVAIDTALDFIKFTSRAYFYSFPLDFVLLPFFRHSTSGPYVLGQGVD